VIDHGGGTDQPGIGGSGLFIAPPLGAEHRGFLLRLADEQYTFLCGALLPIGGRHVIFALALLEQYDRHFLLNGELFHMRDERFGDGIHQGAGGERVAAMKAEKAGDPSGPLQRGHVHVQVHAVDAFDLQRHMFRQDLGHTA